MAFGRAKHLETGVQVQKVKYRGTPRGNKTLDCPDGLRRSCRPIGLLDSPRGMPLVSHLFGGLESLHKRCRKIGSRSREASGFPDGVWSKPRPDATRVSPRSHDFGYVFACNYEVKADCLAPFLRVVRSSWTCYESKVFGWRSADRSLPKRNGTEAVPYSGFLSAIPGHLHERDGKSREWKQW